MADLRKFGFHEEHDYWPLLQEAAKYLAASPAEPCDQDEAERWLLQAIADGEVVAAPVLGGADWLLKLTDEMHARLWRRYLDASMPRQEEEAC